MRYSGFWKNGELDTRKIGQKRVYSDFNLKEVMEEYEGYFVNMKYEGSGKITLKNKVFVG